VVCKFLTIKGKGGIKMRVSKKEIQDKDVITALLSESPVGRLGTIGRGGWPMIKPINFVYFKGKIYFHSAREGEKIENIKSDSRVCFEIDTPIGYAKSTGNPCETDYLYRSVIIKGKAHVVSDRGEQLSALKALMEKYQPEGDYDEFREDKLALTAVVKIDIDEMTGKEDIGHGSLREVALKLLQTKAPLPAAFQKE
jgi:uncharacterized protein